MCRHWFESVVPPYLSTCHFLIVPCVVFLFVNVSLFLSATCVFPVVTRGVDVAIFCSTSCHLEVPTRVVFLLGHVSCSGLHVSVSYLTTRPFRTTTRPKPVHQARYMQTFVHIHFIIERMKCRYYSEKLALLFRESIPQPIKLQPNKFVTQPNELETTK